MMRIVLVGAGSVEFTRNLLGDILSYPELARTPRSSSMTSTPIACARPSGWPAGRGHGAGRRPRVEAAPGPAGRARGRRPRHRHHPGRRRGRATQLDFDVPARYGLRYTINDTINVGGVLRGLRTIPVVLGIVADMEDVCPDACSSTTPTRWRCSCGPSRGRGMPTVGLCHSVYWTVQRWPATWASRSRRSTHTRPA